MYRSLFRGVVVLLGLPAVLIAATATFDIELPDSDTNSVTVAPGADVPYVVTVIVTSDDPNTPDNSGLGSFNVNIVTNLRIMQRPIDAFDPAIDNVFTVSQTLGTPTSSFLLGITHNIMQISAAQDSTPGTQPTLNVGLGQKQVLATGRLVTPSSEDTFSAIIDGNSTATVYRALIFSAIQPEIAVGPGIAITTRSTPATDDDTDTDPDSTGGDADSGDTSTDGEESVTDPIAGTGDPLVGSVAFVIGLGMLIAGTFLWGGPVLGLFMLLFAPLVALLILAQQATGG